MFEIYKRSQGYYTRLLTAVGLVIIAAIGCYSLFRKLEILRDYTRFYLYWQAGIPAAVFLASGALAYWVVNWPKAADFMIATEGEMKKVSWSSKRELIRSTMVVVLFVVAMALMYWAVDQSFAFLFRWIGVIRAF
jgi:preprotein translocase subunit SecE